MSAPHLATGDLAPTPRPASRLRFGLGLLAVSALAATLSLAVSLLLPGHGRATLGDDKLPDLLPYEGTLAKDGAPFSGKVTLELRLYDDPGSTAPVWTERQDVVVSDGHFSVLLGAASGSGYLRGVIEGADDLYLETALVAGNGETHAFPGRRRFTPAPAALITKAFSDASVHAGLAITAARSVDEHGIAGPLAIHDSDGGVIGIDGSDLDAFAPLALQARSKAGARAGGDLDAAGGLAVQASAGATAYTLFRRVGSDLHVDPDVALSGTSVNTPVAFQGDVTGLTAVNAPGSCEDVGIANGNTSQTIVCSNGRYLSGGTFQGNYSDGKTLSSIRCCAMVLYLQ
ncbi:MAG: hypothetical protein U1F43_17040 [Myxococcota bacterium]